MIISRLNFEMKSLQKWSEMTTKQPLQMNLTGASITRLKRETTLESLSVTGHLDNETLPPHGIGHNTKALSLMAAQSLPSEETLPSPSSSSSQIQHRAQVTLERDNSR